MIFTAVNLIAQKDMPKISSTEQTFNFKDISQNKILKHDFYIKNIGKKVLKIRDIKSSCECTVIKPVRKEIEPGDSLKVTAEFNTVNKIGYQRHHVYILSNDPIDPEYRLSLIGNVVLTKDEEESLPKIKIPYTVYDFGDVKQGKVLNHKIEIKNIGKELLRIKKVKTGCNSIKLSIKKKKLKYNESTILNVKFNTKKLSGKQSCIVTIKSNDPRVRVAIITVMANVIK
jgi:hypothetical protein